MGMPVYRVSVLAAAFSLVAAGCGAQGPRELDWGRPAPGAHLGALGLPDRVIHTQTGIVFVLIPAGTCMVGAREEDAGSESWEKPQRSVSIPQPFYMSAYEVTQDVWQRVMGSNPSERAQGGRFPVESVSWSDIQKFLRTTGLRLPTAAEWEYACRAGTTGPRYGDIDIVAWNSGQEWASVTEMNSDLHEVGGKAPNAFGLYDMLGNVAEWCSDRFEASGDGRVIRGGSSEDSRRRVAAYTRGVGKPDEHFADTGFRVARDP